MLKPLAKVASGGELSRLMLALKWLLARHDRVETVIFDEIDAGISGQTAEAVAGKIRELAGHHQVICITHLPQIAAARRRAFYRDQEGANGGRYPDRHQPGLAARKGSGSWPGCWTENPPPPRPGPMPKNFSARKRMLMTAEQPTALALFSGGLDSILACRVIMAQGIPVKAVKFVTPFFGGETVAR